MKSVYLFWDSTEVFALLLGKEECINHNLLIFRSLHEGFIFFSVRTRVGIFQFFSYTKMTNQCFEQRAVMHGHGL